MLQSKRSVHRGAVSPRGGLRSRRAIHQAEGWQATAQIQSERLGMETLSTVPPFPSSPTSPNYSTCSPRSSTKSPCNSDEPDDPQFGQNRSNRAGPDGAASPVNAA